MIKLELPYPVVLSAQVAQLKEKVPDWASALDGFAHYMAGIHRTKDGSLETVRMYDLGTYNLTKDECFSHNYKENGPFWYGPQAIQALCERAKIPFSPLSEVFIPDDVEKECSETEWEDISYFVSRIETSLYRLRKLKEADAPTVILSHELRCIVDKVNDLESNSRSHGHLHERDNGQSRRALNDIGYSLADGWDKDMQRYFAERTA